MGNGINRFYEFGPFRIDPARELLLRSEELVPLTSKAFQTLLALVENSGQVVPKDQLMRTLWPGTFVEESNLTQTVFVLRKALLQTLHKACLTALQVICLLKIAEPKIIRRTSHSFSLAPKREFRTVSLCLKPLP